ncbi:hypothetical protein C8R41DRAFT_849262 [Lentinula lateritia]|uniref:Uncharacterized protein n=1 Tax=Lentinula lateritia TaxID=40482 RepID=A0ABQ8V4R8_9AGAR|nr:hypothetical protein C8R41DRAFT_849262 [Lentinula lateritia]
MTKKCCKEMHSSALLPSYCSLQLWEEYLLLLRCLKLDVQVSEHPKSAEGGYHDAYYTRAGCRMSTRFYGACGCWLVPVLPCVMFVYKVNLAFYEFGWSFSLYLFFDYEPFVQYFFKRFPHPHVSLLSLSYHKLLSCFPLSHWYRSLQSVAVLEFERKHLQRKRGKPCSAINDRPQALRLIIFDPFSVPRMQYYCNSSLHHSLGLSLKILKNQMRLFIITGQCSIRVQHPPKFFP